VGVAHDLTIHVRNELLYRHVHLQRLELELEARSAASTAKEDVANDLGALELRQRPRLAHGRLLEAPWPLGRVDVLRQILLEEGFEQAAGREEAREILWGDVLGAGAGEGIAAADRLDAKVGQLGTQLGVDPGAPSSGRGVHQPLER